MEEFGASYPAFNKIENGGYKSAFTSPLPVEQRKSKLGIFFGLNKYHINALWNVSINVYSLNSKVLKYFNYRNSMSKRMAMELLKKSLERFVNVYLMI